MAIYPYRLQVERRPRGGRAPLPPRAPAGSHRGCGGQTGPIPGCARDDRGVPGQGVEMPAQQIAFSKSMNWALSLPGACLPEVQSAPGRPMLTHLPPFTGSMSWSLYRLLVQIGCGLNEQPSAEWMVSAPSRSEEHTSELQSLMRISYAVFCLKKKTITKISEK